MTWPSPGQQPGGAGIQRQPRPSRLPSAGKRGSRHLRSPCTVTSGHLAWTCPGKSQSPASSACRICCMTSRRGQSARRSRPAHLAQVLPGHGHGPGCSSRRCSARRVHARRKADQATSGDRHISATSSNTKPIRSSPSGTTSRTRRAWAPGRSHRGCRLWVQGRSGPGCWPVPTGALTRAGRAARLHIGAGGAGVPARSGTYVVVPADPPPASAVSTAQSCGWLRLAGRSPCPGRTAVPGGAVSRAGRRGLPG